MKIKVSAIATYNSLLRDRINDFLKMKLKEVGADDLVPSYGSLLYVVYTHGGRVQISVLYNTLLKQKTTITEMINRLVKLGYLKKEKCAEDRRVTYVIATEKAMDIKKKFDNISEDLLNKLYDGFTEGEKSEFVRLMQKAIKNFS
ncbi:MarR family winged helix-turn-helix transcriptional regulator [Clostridium ganghwense]|uniref:Winged helix DNA-binding protein n=1 Tax=Clostridium ganghwense TaxID=312089 RepID=A0ABT4CJN8_9CLOT|nr:winged helix DNA-binding protein [Clostridium ganghwense]MCY6369263.1 winged helix DNA-binding protein [Clostridium ganghwense]